MELEAFGKEVVAGNRVSGRAVTERLMPDQFPSGYRSPRMTGNFHSKLCVASCWEARAQYN